MHKSCEQVVDSLSCGDGTASHLLASLPFTWLSMLMLRLPFPCLLQNQYLVKWCGLDYTDSTWELEYEMDQGDIDKFERRSKPRRIERVSWVNSRLGQVRGYSTTCL